jgi:hypothetical protein
VAGGQEIVEKYNRLAPNNQILMSADKVCAPDKAMAKYFKKKDSGYDYLCGGGMIGKAKILLDTFELLFEGIEEDESQENKDFYWSDQYLWTKLYLSKKVDIILDHNCEIFQTFTSEASIKNLYEFVNNEPELSEYEDLYQRKSLFKTIEAILEEIEITDNGRVLNKTTGTYPVQIHFNTKINKLVMFMEPFVQLIEKVNP